jgi:RNA polymerase primary sigma factor
VPAFEEAQEEQPGHGGDAAPPEIAAAADNGEGTLEGEALATAAWNARLADCELALALDRPEPAGSPATARYLDELGRRPALQQGQERELVLAAQTGDRRARAQLVEAFLPLIGSIARLYRESPRVARVELLQEGVVGLLRALERYDPDRGTPFWAYASWWVRQAMQQLVSELTRPVVLSDRALRQLARVRDAHRQVVRETGREPGRTQLAERAGLSGEQVDNLLAVDRSPRSIDEPVSGDEGQIGALGELLADPLAEGEYERVLEAIEAEELLSLLSGLSERERAILRLRYGLDTGREETLREIAGRLGLSAERVRQLEERALGKLAVAAGARGDAA